MTRRRGRRRKQLLDDRKNEKIRKLKEEALDRTLWRTRFVRGYGRIVRHSMWIENEILTNALPLSAQATMYLINVLSQTVKRFDCLIPIVQYAKDLAVKGPRLLISLHFSRC